MRILLALLALIASLVSAQANELLNIEKAAFVSFSVNATSPTFVLPSGSTLKFMNVNGCDHNTGTAATGGDSGACSGSAGQVGPWLNATGHTMNCGEVIIAAAGAYGPQNSGWGTVSNCPSTTGGIDGTGGVYFATLLCGGPFAGACTITGTLNSIGGIEATADHWAVEGWQVSEGYNCTTNSGFGFEINTASSARKYVAFINDIANHNASGFGINAHGPGGDGADYVAFVGDIAQDSAGLCAGGISTAAMVLIGIENADTAAGTHILVQGNYSYNNQQTLGASDQTDGECYMMDTLDFPTPGYSQQIVFRNNISAVCERDGLHIFYQAFSSTTPVIKVYNNTLVASNQMANSTLSGINNQGDIGIQSANNGGSGLPMPWLVSVYQNIIKENFATTASGNAQIFTIMNGGDNATAQVIGGSGFQNMLSGLFTGTCAATCDTGHSTKSIIAFSPSVIGTNTYQDPGLNNLADAIANRIGTPNCTGFTTTAACVGNNFGGAPTNPSLVFDLTATAGGTSGIGYQPPGPCVSSDPDYPTWLKGVVHLHWNGATITENAGLITKPCGL